MQAALPGSEQGARYGRCKLTLEDGLFIKSHILPDALTRHDVRGEAIFQIGNSRRPTRRRTSWYDRQLVTLSGERILTSYDTWAIRQLRLHKLVWSGWGRQTLGGSVDGVDATGFGVRVSYEEIGLHLDMTPEVVRTNLVEALVLLAGGTEAGRTG